MLKVEVVLKVLGGCVEVVEVVLKVLGGCGEARLLVMAGAGHQRFSVRYQRLVVLYSRIFLGSLPSSQARRSGAPFVLAPN